MVLTLVVFSIEQVTPVWIKMIGNLLTENGDGGRAFAPRELGEKAKVQNIANLDPLLLRNPYKWEQTSRYFTECAPSFLHSPLYQLEAVGRHILLKPDS